MPQAAHHNAVVGYNGKIYAFGGGIQRQPGGPTQFPVDNSWEYDPAADSWRALAPMPIRRLAAAAVESGGKIYVMGGVAPYPGLENQSLSGEEPHRVLDLNHMRSRDQHVAASSNDADGAEPHVCRSGERQDLRHRRPRWINGSGHRQHHGSRRGATSRRIVGGQSDCGCRRRATVEWSVSSRTASMSPGVRASRPINNSVSRAVEA